MYGGFDYANIIIGTQWTALWYRDGKLVCFETEPWKEEWSTGGIGGRTVCSSPIGGWTVGAYEVQIFMGYEMKRNGRFIVLGDLATPTPTGTVSATSTP